MKETYSREEVIQVLELVADIISYEDCQGMEMWLSKSGEDLLKLYHDAKNTLDPCYDRSTQK